MVLYVSHGLIVVVLEQTAKWQRVEQLVEPVVSAVVDVRVY